MTSISKLALAATAAMGMLATATPAAATSDPFLGQLMLFGGSFCPRGWAVANGDLMPISKYQALFSLLGTTYGGDGRTTFALPNLEGRPPVGSSRSLRPGRSQGAASVTVKADAITHAGDGQSVQLQSPALAMLWCVATVGVYPSRP